MQSRHLVVVDNYPFFLDLIVNGKFQGKVLGPIKCSSDFREHLLHHYNFLKITDNFTQLGPAPTLLEPNQLDCMLKLLVDLNNVTSWYGSNFKINSSI